MIFDQVLARFRPHTGKQSSSKHKKRKQFTSATKAKFQQPLLQASEHLNTTNKLNQALQEINKAVQQKTATDQQLLLKAEILLRKEKFRKAKVALTELSSQSQDQKTLNTSKHLLEQLPHLQQQSSQDKARTLVSDLHNIAETYQTKLSSLPAPDELTPDFDITLSIRRESRLARSSDLPCLSHDLIERTLQSGDESPWLLHDKALSLNMMGQQQAALKLLADLKKTTGKEKLTQSINKNIEAIQKNPKNYQLKSKLFFAKQIKIAARRNHLDHFIPESRSTRKHASSSWPSEKQEQSCQTIPKPASILSTPSSLISKAIWQRCCSGAKPLPPLKIPAQPWKSGPIWPAQTTKILRKKRLSLCHNTSLAKLEPSAKTIQPMQPLLFSLSST